MIGYFAAALLATIYFIVSVVSIPGATIKRLSQRLAEGHYTRIQRMAERASMAFRESLATFLDASVSRTLPTRPAATEQCNWAAIGG